MNRRTRPIALAVALTLAAPLAACGKKLPMPAGDASATATEAASEDAGAGASPTPTAPAEADASAPSPPDDAAAPEAAAAADTAPAAVPDDPQPTNAEVDALIDRLRDAHPEADGARVARGVRQVAALWRKRDGDLEAFVDAQLALDDAAHDALFARLEATMEQLDGHANEVGRAMRWGSDVADGPLLPVDGLLATYDPYAHLSEDLFQTKVAFAVLLNFPLSTVAERAEKGADWTRRQWAEARLAGAFDRRVPGEVNAAIAAASAEGDAYVAGYNLWMHHVLGEGGERRFPKGKRLISHWNLRDELKANYADADGLDKQRTIVRVMERIVTQEIPRAVIDDPRLDWNPFTNEVTLAPADTVEAEAPKRAAPAVADAAREPDTRFQHVLALFHAQRLADPYSPAAPTALARAFETAELPEERVRALLLAILESPLVKQAAAEVERRLGRPLEPQDLWYEFGGGDTPEGELDAVTRARYPTAAAFAEDLPRILGDLGFTPEKAAFLADHIEVDPSRGAGHAMQATRRGDKPHLRTRVEPGGMDYKGYNIAVHELGHNVEQVFSLYEVDHTLLSGVPNTAFTEALAFLFQARDLALLGRPTADAEHERLRVLDDFWNCWEITGSALVELDVWRWLYEHPEASAAELREATVRIARETWARYYAPVLHGEDVSLLGIYSHTLSIPLYLFNYVLGHLIAFQVEQHVAGADKALFAREFEFMAKQGRIGPDLWMKGATGAPVSAEPLLTAAKNALSGTPE